ncbi:MAG: hypothetical protein RBQ71_04970 [Acholeplasmataceae bacterium]|jgi:hypothetical protein|nr:hypothetical protein [Acholeplasmataceae bacterium]
MKKLMSFIVILLALFTMSSCMSPDDETAKLIAQYDHYIEEDIVDQHVFNAFINSVSNDIMPGVVLVRMTVKNRFNVVVRVSEGTGFIYDAHDNQLRVVTSLDVVLVGDDTLIPTYEILDFADRNYSASLEDRSLTYNLAKLQFNANIQITRLHELKLADEDPMNQEPLMMLSNYQSIRNAMTMGLLLEKQNDNLLYITSILGDELSIGGVLINMRQEVTGMVVRINDEDQSMQIFGVDALKDYLKE